MQLISNSFSLLVTYSFVNMAFAPENGTLSINESSIPMSLKSINITETIKENTSGLDNEYVYVTEKSESDFIENGGLQNVTSEFDDSREESGSEMDDIHSSFNLALIPVAAVFVFIVLTCIKCCKWFRHYTKGGSKDDIVYVVIMPDDDKEYGHIKITSDSTFLKHSGNNRTLSSIKASRQESIRSNNSTSSSCQTAKRSVNNGEPDMKPFTSCSSTRAHKNETIGDFDVRISSFSSTETVSEQINESPVIRRNERFRVSFVTEAKPFEPEYRTENGNIKLEKVIRSNLKKSSSTITSHETPSPMETKMVDIGTQTNKSFRDRLRKSKGHVSESDLDERLFCRISMNISAFKSEDSQCKDDDDGNNLRRNSDNDHTKANKHVKHSSVFPEREKICSHSTCIPEIPKYPLDTNVEVIHTGKETKESNGDLDSDEAVFIDVF